MTADRDLIIPLSGLVAEGDDSATAPEGITDPTIAGALLTSVLARHANALIDGGHAELVSLAVDVTGSLNGAPLAFRSRLDRRTRTLVFINGEAVENGAPRLRATAIYRVVAS